MAQLQCKKEDQYEAAAIEKALRASSFPEGVKVDIEELVKEVLAIKYAPEYDHHVNHQKEEQAAEYKLQDLRTVRIEGGKSTSGPIVFEFSTPPNILRRYIFEGSAPQGKRGEGRCREFKSKPDLVSHTNVYLLHAMADGRALITYLHAKTDGQHVTGCWEGVFAPPLAPGPGFVFAGKGRFIPLDR